MRKFEVVKNKNKFFLLSAVIIALGIVFYFINGLQLDVEYRGGTRILIETNSEIDTNQADAVVEEVLGKSVTTQSLKTYNPEDEDKMIYMLRFDIASDETLTDEERTLVYDTVASNFDVKENGNHDMLSVSPTIGKETLLNGLKACFIASVLIVLYVTWRFSALSGFSAAITAIIALLHDVAVVFSLYTIFRLSVSEVFITAVLTIIGYSLNNTIVVYDRVRENNKIMKKQAIEEIVDASINQSFSRTINTSVTTLITIVCLYIFAAVNNISSLMEFSLPLIVGFVAGTYSSLFIASPLWMMWRKSAMRKTLKSA